jgi:Domain of unknown function (DUF932)
MWSSTFVADATFQRISIKHSGFNPDSVIEASFEVLSALPDIMNKVQLFQDRILTDAERMALARGAATYRWEDLSKAPVNPLVLLNPRRFGDGAKDLWTTLNTKTLSAAASATTRAADPTGATSPKAGPSKALMKISSSTRPSGTWPKSCATRESN